MGPSVSSSGLSSDPARIRNDRRVAPDPPTPGIDLVEHPLVHDDLGSSPRTAVERSRPRQAATSRLRASPSTLASTPPTPCAALDSRSAPLARTTTWCSSCSVRSVQMEPRSRGCCADSCRSRPRPNTSPMTSHHPSRRRRRARSAVRWRCPACCGHDEVARTPRGRPGRGHRRSGLGSRPSVAGRPGLDRGDRRAVHERRCASRRP